jgi:hypothetical protein
MTIEFPKLPPDATFPQHRDYLCDGLTTGYRELSNMLMTMLDVGKAVGLSKAEREEAAVEADRLLEQAVKWQQLKNRGVS